MSDLIISVSGLRGVVGDTLTPEIAMNYAVAFASILPAGGIVITRDGRESGCMLADAIHSALNAVGRNTFDASITATPTTGILVRQLAAAGGIQITASHNPIEFNGMKLFSSEGRVIPKNIGESVLQKYNVGKLNYVNSESIGKRVECKNTITKHQKAIIETINLNAIADRKFRVLLDSNHGAGALLGAWLFDELECEVTILGEEPSGHFLHVPEPTRENLAQICDVVKYGHFDIAFCQDPDADRVAIIDETGRYIGEELTVAISLEHVLGVACAKNKSCAQVADSSKLKPHTFSRNSGAIVINCATSRVNEDIAQRFGVPIYRSAVGEANVVDLMLKTGAIFGGEGNGGPIDPAVGLVRDSFVGMAQVLDAMATSGKKISELADNLPQYSLVKRKANIELSNVPMLLDKVAEVFKNLPCDRLDGLRIDHGDAWVLLRGSNTEPIIRIFAEAPNEQKANELCDEIENLI
ncbi:MAG: phosphoglucosamine mutase [Planctomycetaceae bacterium]|jgi:phosphomannomutase|nr:phosphoglucosamine mutase [Planctomycetaceae bacterium]